MISAGAFRAEIKCCAARSPMMGRGDARVSPRESEARRARRRGDRGIAKLARLLSYRAW